MTRAVPHHWLLFAGSADTGLAVQLEPAMSKKGVSLSFTPGPIGERLNIVLKTSEDDTTPLTDAYRDLENSARNGGGCGYVLLQSEDHLRCEATFRFQLEKKYLNSDALQNVSGASADLLFGLAVVTAVRSDLDYPPFAATGILNEDGSVSPIEGLCAKINAALEISALHGKGLIFYPKANDGDIDAELRYRVDLAQIRLVPVERLEQAVECLGIPIQGAWLENPYRRLDVFEYSHRRIYFGRENEAAHLVDILLQREESGRPGLLILGPSGGGKSSLVRAGLIPELEKRLKDRSLSLLFSVWDLRDAANKDVHAIAASIRSSWSLLPGLAALAVNSSSNQQAAILSPQETFTALVRELADYLPEQTRFVWVLDQLEQFFTLNLSQEADVALIQFLRELQGRGIWIVATFRNDFYSVLQAHDGILSLFDKDGIHDLEKLSETTIERIIQKPARLAKLEFEVDDQKSERLSLKLKNDALGGGKDILPLLEFALYQLYEKRELKNGRSQMTWAAYEAMGGLSGAIGNRADDVLHSLDESAQETLSQVLRALAKLRRDSMQIESGKSPFIARVVNVEQCPLGASAHRLIDAFAEARLFVRDRDNQDIAQVRVTHEALFTHWSKANEILRNSIKDLELRDRLADRAAHWQENEKEPSLLLQTGLPLVEAQDLLARLGDELDAEIIDYIEQSSIADQERKQQESEAQRRKIRFVSVTAVVLGILLLVATSAGYFAYQSKNELEQGRNELAATLAHSDFSEGARLIEQGQSKEALAYLVRAMRPDSDPDTAAARLAASLLLSPSHSINISTMQMPKPCGSVDMMVQFSPDGRWILANCDHGGAQIWDAISGKPLLRQMQHESSVRSAQFSPDGRWVVTASWDKTARVWEVATGKPVSQPMQHEEAVSSAQFSPDGRWVVTVSEATVRFWEAATGRLVSQLMQPDQIADHAADGVDQVFAAMDRLVSQLMQPGQTAGRDDQVIAAGVRQALQLVQQYGSPVLSVQFSPDGQWVVTASGDGTARVWEAATGRPVSQPMQHENPVFSAQFSPDGRWVVVTAFLEKTAQVWEAATGRPVSQLAQHEDMVLSAQFSPDGRWVVTASRDGTARVWETATGEPISQPMQHEDIVHSAQFSPDGRWMVTASNDGAARVWEAATGEPVSQPMQHEGPVRSAQFSPDGRWVVTASSDKTVRIWEAATGRLVSQPMVHGSPVRSAQFSSDGRQVVTDSVDKMVRVWEAATGAPVLQPVQHESFVRSEHFSPDGHWVVTFSDDKTARVREAVTGRPVSQPMQHESSVRSAQFSPDGRWVVTVSDDKMARVWEAATGRLVSQPMQHEEVVYSVQFSPDGRWVVTAFDDKTAQVWEIATGRPVLQPMKHGSEVRSVQFSPDGRWVVTVSDDKTARVWEAATGAPVSQPMKHGSTAHTAQFSPDGRWVVTVFDHKTVQVWEAETGRLVSQPMQHEGRVRSAQFSPDGRWVITADDTVARVWGAATGRPVSQPMVHGNSLRSAQFSPDGRWVVTISWDETARVWEAATGRPVSQPIQHMGSGLAQFSSDGRWMVTATNEKTVRVWEMETGKSVFVSLGHERMPYFFPFRFDDHRIITQSDNGTMRVWEIPRLPGNSSGFIEFLERVSGYVVNSNNVLQTKYTDSTVSELRDWTATATDLTQEERAFIDWWLSDPLERTVTPTSTQTVKERVQMLIERDTIVSLNEALDYHPGHSMALARLAAATWRESGQDQQDDIHPRVALWANLALKYASEDADVRAVAEKVLQDIALPD